MGHRLSDDALRAIASQGVRAVVDKSMRSHRKSIRSVVSGPLGIVSTCLSDEKFGIIVDVTNQNIRATARAGVHGHVGSVGLHTRLSQNVAPGGVYQALTGYRPVLSFELSSLRISPDLTPLGACLCQMGSVSYNVYAFQRAPSVSPPESPQLLDSDDDRDETESVDLLWNATDYDTFEPFR